MTSATDNRTTELLDGLRNVGNLDEFAELFGFNWSVESDWTWHDVAVKMADELEQAIAATLGRPTWRNSYDQQRYDQWYDSLFHGEPSSFKELIEDVIWTTETIDLGPNGNECQGVDEGEVQAESMIATWAEKAAALGCGKCRSTTPDDAWCFVCSKCGKSFPMNELHLAHNHGEINYCPNCGSEVVDA